MMESRKTRHATNGRSGALLLLLLSGLRRKIRPRHHFPDSVTDIADGTTKAPPKDGSIIVVIATSAPLHPTQLRRLAKRATVGLARSGGLGQQFLGRRVLGVLHGSGVDGPETLMDADGGDLVRCVEDDIINMPF